MVKTLRYLINGLTIIGVASALAYCERKSEEARAEIQIACIKAGGEWVRMSKYCKITKLAEAE